MKRGILLAALALALAAPAGAQQAAPWSWGPSLPFVTVSWPDGSKAKVGAFDAGAGVSLNYNTHPSPDGLVRWLNVGFPVFVHTDGTQFSLTPGATLGIYNNLVALGVAADLVNVGDTDSGLLLGDFSKRNVKILLAFGFNIGGGVPAPSKAAGSPRLEPPPCYMKF